MDFVYLPDSTGLYAEMLPTKSPLGIRGAFKGTSQGVVTFTTRARPLPDEITTFLQRNVFIIQKLQRERDVRTEGATTNGHGFESLDGSAANGNAETKHEEDAQEEEDGAALDTQQDELVQRPTVSSIDEFWTELGKLLDAAGSDFATSSGGGNTGQDLAGKIWAFGPNRVGPNILFRTDGGGGGLS